MAFKKSPYLLLILPIVYLILSGVFFTNWTPLYRLYPDPSYAYLLNGMTLANGNMQIGLYEHPGTTVQCFIAAILYIKHLFNPGTVLYQDVLLHTESYLYAVCVCITIFYVLATLLSGYYIYKHTRNVALAVLFQLAPLLYHRYVGATVDSPESFLIIGGMLFVAYIYCNSIYKYPQEVRLKTIIIYGLFAGFLVATKFTWLPFLLITLFLLPTSKSRLIYLLSFFLFFITFLIPAIPKWHDMWQWVYDIFTHTGNYGLGDKGIINPHQFFNRIVYLLFKTDAYLTVIYLATSAALVVLLIKRKKLQNKTDLKLLAGVWLSSTILILLIAKHLSEHYLLPIKMCFPLAIAGSFPVLKDLFKTIKNKNSWYKPLFTGIVAFLITLNLLYYFRHTINPSTVTSSLLHKYTGTPVIITSDYNSSCIEPALSFGNAYCGDLHNKYWEFLKKAFPYSYLYKQNSNEITFWDDIFYTPELFSKHPEILVYFNDKDSIARDSILHSFCIWEKDTLAHSRLVYHLKKSSVYNYKAGLDYDLVYNPPETDEYIYELDGNQTKAKALMANHSDVTFDFEKLTPDYTEFISTDEKSTMKRTNLLNSKEHHSGNNSILLNQQNQFGINYTIKVPPGAIINVSIWRKSDDGSGCIVFNSKTDADFYHSGQAVIDSTSTGWKQIEYKCRVPHTVKDSSIMTYLFYYGHSNAYFDDICIKVYPMKLDSTFTK